MADGEIAEKTEALFQDICDMSGNAMLRQTIGLINAHLHLIRPYEGAFIPDRNSEYEAMAAAWAKRDMPRLRELTTAYFKRRRDLVPQIAKIINRPN
jgi:DNA-binding GntR family transcriptional regulator